MNKPLVPEDLYRDRDPQRLMQSIARAAVANVRARFDRSMTAEHHAKAAWPFDQDAQLILRAAVTPHSMSDTATLVQIALAVLPMLRPYSAAAQLFEAGLSITLGRSPVTVPNLGVANVAFVAEGAPKPAVQGLSSGARLDPFKIAGIVPVSSELFAQEGIETIMRAMLAESAGPVLDAAVFSNAAATSARPAGLLNGIAGLTPDAGTGAKSDAMVADLSKLAAAIAPVSGGSKIAIIMAAGQFVAFASRSARDQENLIVVPAPIAAGTVIAVATNAIVSAMGVPEFETSTQATITMDDAPQAWPAPPVSSMFQTASVATKMELPVTWARRSAQGVAWMAGTNW